MQAGLALTVERVNAAGAGFITYSMDDEGYIVNLESYVSTTDFLISVDSDGEYDITYDSLEQDGNVEHFGHIYELRLNGGANAIIGSEVTIDNILLNDQSASLEILEGSKLTCVDIRGSGRTVTIQKGGILECDEGFVLSDISSDYIYVYGSIVSYKIDLTASRQNIYTSDDTVFKATTSFINGAYDLEGFVDTELSTYISSESGAFTLRAGGATKRISGQFSNKMAVNLLDNPNVTLNNVPDVYYGQDYDFSSLISTAEGYEGETYIEYADNMQNVLEEKPSYPYNFPYYVRAVASSYGPYLEAHTDWQPFLIQYLPLISEEDEDGEVVIEGLYPAGTKTFFTVTGVENEKYVGEEGITLTAPEGIRMQFPYSGNEDLLSPANPVTLTHDDLFLEGYTTVNEDFAIQFVREDGATTEARSIVDAVPGLEDYVFDTEDPQIEAELFPLNSSESHEISLEESTVSGSKLNFTVSDENLSEVLLSVNGEETDISNLISDDNDCVFSVNCDYVGDIKEILITAIDKAGRESQAQITLVSEPEYLSIENGSSGMIISLTPSETESLRVYVTPDTEKEGYYAIYCERSDGSDDPEEFNFRVENIEKFELYGDSTLKIVEAEIEAEIYLDSSSTEVSVESDAVLTCTGLSGFGSIWNYASIVFQNFDSSEYSSEDCAITVYNLNPGKIIADNIDISTTSCVIDGEAISTLEQVEGSVFQATTSFTKGNGDLLATVVAASGNTNIKSAGGTFTLELDGKTKEIDGEVDDTAAYLFLEPITVTLEDLPENVYYGQTLDDVFSGSITVEPEGYDGEPYFEYSKDGEIYSTTEPNSSSFYVRAVAPATTVYAEGVSETARYTRKYLTASDISSTGNLYTLEGVTNGKYVTDSVTIVPPDGFQISTNITGLDDYSDSITITDEDILSGNLTALSNLQIFYRRSDGAYSQAIGYTASSGTNPNFQDLVLDKAAPAINNAKADGESVTITDGGNIVADSLTFSVFDANLESVLVNDTEYTVSGTSVSVTLESTALAEPEEITVYATDLAGREMEISFTLSHTPIDPERATVTLEDVYYGEDYEPVVDTDSDGEVTIYYRKGVKGSSSKILDEKPTEPGTYIVYAEISATDNYNATECSAEFEIKKAIPTITFIIPEEIYAGEEYVIEVETNSDAEVFKRFYYNDGGLRDTVFETEPTNFDEYIVTVTLQETDHYEYATASETYTVLGRSFTPTLTVEDCVVGETPVPVLTGIPEDYTGTITYEHKTNIEGMETDYAEGWPTLYGSYTVRAVFPSTGVYYGTFCTDDFTISKKSVQATVSVDDIYVGGTISPVLTITEPEDYELLDEPIYQYKLTAAPDSAYSDTVPNAAGEYTVQVLVPGSDVYNGTTCTDTFEIKKYETSVTVTVGKLTYGDPVEPVVSVTPADYDNTENISFEYKLSTDPDNKYSFTVPTDAGTYTLLVTVPASDKFTGTSREVEFTIGKLQISADVTVEGITYGEEVTPVVITDPEEYDGNVEDYVFEYKPYMAEDNEYSETVPVNAGTYSVKVTLPDTDNYIGTVCDNTFTIGKSDITDAEVSVDNIKVGQVPAPSVTGLPEDYDGTIAYAYIDEDGDECAAESLAAGTYAVFASISDTGNYAGMTCETDLEVSKYDINDAEVTVENIKVGQVPSPVVTGLPDDYDGDITYTYIDEDGDECAAESLAAGTYAVFASISDTDTYVGMTCETGLEVSKSDITDVEVSVDDIKVGQVPAPSLTGLPADYDGEITIEYLGGNGENGSADSLAAGSYLVRVTIPETDKYEGTSCETDLEVSKYDIAEAEVTIENIKVGQVPAPSIKGIPEDYDGEITIEYLGGNGENGSADSLAAGSYLVRVTIPETDKYEKKVLETDLVVSKNDITEVKVTVESIKVGQTPAPVVTGLPADYDGTITFEYFDGEGENCSADSLAAGGYHVIASIPETDKYERTICETDLVVSKNGVTASVTVADILVGGDVDPVIMINPEDYDGEITIEYKGDAGQGYSTTVPTAAGSYSVRVTLSETDKYLGTTCEDTFTISKNAATASVTVADIYVGGTVKPVVTTESNGKVTFEYKLSSAPDTAYTTTVPTAAGEYTVRATIAATAEYLGTTCEGTFKILKLEVTVKVLATSIYVGNEPELSISTNSNGARTIEYKLKNDPDTAYSKTVPKAAGEYTVRVTIAETDKYLGTSGTADFKISKMAATAKVSVADIYVGETPSPLITTNSNGAVTFEYKRLTDPDTAYTNTVPVAAGGYEVRVTIAETDKYLSTTCMTIFSIIKRTATATVTVENITVGGTVKPVVITNSDGKATFEYKLSTDPDTAYDVTVPSVAGEYTVRATIATTDTYLSTTCTATFKIIKIAVDASVSVSDILVGGTVDPVMTGIPEDYEGTVTYKYKAETADDSAYTSTVPSEAGKYTVLAKISETDKYLGTTCTGTFTISKNETTATVTVADIYVGGKVTPVVTTVSNGKDSATFEYKLSSDPDENYSETVPTAAGEYTVRATIPATVEYAGIVCTSVFKIMLNPVTKMELTVPDIYYGQPVKPVLETESDGKVTIMYKPSDADDSEYTDKAPAAVGKYTAIAIVDATDFYASASVKVEFSISYLENPQIVYVPSGTPGDNGYYTSDVDLKAPDGYLISATSDGDFTDKIPFTEDLNVIYLKRIEDNALTAAITLENKPKIDKIAPVFNGTSGGVLEDAILFEDSLVVVVDDLNLRSLTVNGDVIDLNANGANVLTLTRPEDGFMKYHIVAVDVAGNVSTLDITLMADWLKEKIIPAGRALPLVQGEMYYLDVGEWIVTVVNSDGTETESKTVFNGNMPFYVSSDAQYIFKKVT